MFNGNRIAFTTVHYRVGSLEMVHRLPGTQSTVHYRVGSLEMSMLSH